MSHRRTTPGAALALAAALGLIAGCDSKGAEKDASTPPPRPVLAAVVHLQPEAAPRTLPGTIRARVEGDLGFRVGGKVERRLVDAGQLVQPGQVLAELDQMDLDLQLRQARADLVAAATARAGALSELARVSTLHRGGWSTGSDYDRQKTAADEAQGRFDRAVQAVALAERARGYGKLRADAAGVIVSTSVEPGQVVASGQTVMRLARLDEREAAVAVPEALVADVRVGQAVVTLWAAPGKTYAAHLRELAPNADPATRTYAARFALPDADDAVRLGMTATVSIIPAAKQVARVPMAAILDEGHGPNVWVIDAKTGALTKRAVVVERYGAQDATISSGLAEGETIVTLGAQKLDAAQHVRVITRIES
jgi:RND family efflux transporter MFP subunit